MLRIIPILSCLLLLGLHSTSAFAEQALSDGKSPSTEQVKALDTEEVTALIKLQQSIEDA